MRRPRPTASKLFHRTSLYTVTLNDKMFCFKSPSNQPPSELNESDAKSWLSPDGHGKWERYPCARVRPRKQYAQSRTLSTFTGSRRRCFSIFSGLIYLPVADQTYIHAHLPGKQVNTTTTGNRRRNIIGVEAVPNRDCGPGERLLPVLCSGDSRNSNAALKRDNKWGTGATNVDVTAWTFDDTYAWQLYLYWHLYWVAVVDLEHRLITQKYDSIITQSYANVTKVIENSNKEWTQLICGRDFFSIFYLKNKIKNCPLAPYTLWVFSYAMVVQRMNKNECGRNYPDQVCRLG